MWNMLIPAAASLIGGAMGASSAKKAAATQAAAAREAAAAQLQASREANALQAGMYKQGLGMQAPAIRGGQLALSALMSGMGLGPATSGYRPTYGPTGDVGIGQGAPGSVMMQPGGGRMQAGGAGGLVGRGGGMAQPVVEPGGGRMQAGGAGGLVRPGQAALGSPMGATLGALAPGVAGNMINAQGITVDAQGNPIASTGDYGIGNIPVGATEEEMAAAGSPYTGAFTQEFTGQDIYSDPSYQFRLGEGERLLRAQQAAGGNRFSGQAMKDITNYAQGAASQEYGNAYDRFMRNKAALYDRLSSLAGMGSQVGGAAAQGGQTAASQIGQNVMAGARGASDYLTSGAAAQAGGQVGSTGAIIGGINQGLQNWYTQQYMDRFKPTAPGTPAAGER